MKELGEISTDEHKMLIEFVSKQDLDQIYLVGSIFHEISKSLNANKSILVFENIDQLNEKLKAEPINGHYILLKGSNSIGLDKAIEYL